MKRPTIFELTPRVSDWKRSVLQECHPKSASLRNPFRGVGVILLGALKETRDWLKRRHRLLARADIVVFYTTLNQKKALTPVSVHFGRDGCYRLAEEGLGCDTGESGVGVGLGAWINLYALCSMPIVFLDALKAPDLFQLKSVFRCFDQYAKAVGAYFCFRRDLLKIMPNVVFISNDYSGIPRAFAFAAKSCRVKTIYLPHALIGTRHYTPPIPVADVMLYANDVEENRIKERCQSEGLNVPQMIYFPRYARSRDASVDSFDVVKTIGVSINSLDSHSLINQEICKIEREFPQLKFILRPHPSLQFSAETISANINTDIVIDSGPLEDFFDDIDLHLAGSSMMHLDAALHGVPTAIFSDATKNDHHGFFELGLAADVDEVTRSNLRHTFESQQQKLMMFAEESNEKLQKKQSVALLELSDYFLNT